MPSCPPSIGSLTPLDGWLASALTMNVRGTRPPFGGWDMFPVAMKQQSRVRRPSDVESREITQIVRRGGRSDKVNREVATGAGGPGADGWQHGAGDRLTVFDVGGSGARGKAIRTALARRRQCHARRSDEGTVRLSRRTSRHMYRPDQPDAFVSAGWTQGVGSRDVKYPSGLESTGRTLPRHRREVEEAALRADAGAFRGCPRCSLRARETPQGNGYIRGSLADKFDAAADDGVITSARRQRAHINVRDLGNDAVH